MKNIETTLFYKDNFPEEYVITNEEAVALIDYIKGGATEFKIDGDTYENKDLSSISFSDKEYSGEEFITILYGLDRTK